MFKKLICKFRGCYPAGETGFDQPIQNHHCGRCGEAMYTTINVEKRTIEDIYDDITKLDSYFKEKNK